MLVVCDYPRNDEAVERLNPDWLIDIEFYAEVKYEADDETGNLTKKVIPLEPKQSRPAWRPWDGTPKSDGATPAPNMVQDPNAPPPCCQVH